MTTESEVTLNCNNSVVQRRMSRHLRVCAVRLFPLARLGGSRVASLQDEMDPILANAGVPMLSVQMPFLLATLPVVIAAEAVCCHRWIGAPWARAWTASSIANVVSTVVGFPLLWIVLVGIQVLIGRDGMSEITGPWSAVGIVFLDSAWLAPYDDRLYWMVPAASMVLLGPAFFASVGIEQLVYGKFFREAGERQRVRSANWRMHLITYGFLLVIALGLLVKAVAKERSNQPAEPEPSDAASNSSSLGEGFPRLPGFAHG